MKYGSLTYEVKLSQQRLSSICDEAVAAAISSNAMEVNGIEVELKKAGAVTAALEGKSFVLDLPLDIDIRRQAGLFTVEGTGGISIKLKLNYDINNDLQLHVKSELVEHTWITKPKLELGAINIPVETLMNLVLNHYESILTAKVDEAINEKSDLMPHVYKAMTTLEEKINAQIPIDRVADLRLGQISNLTPRTIDGFVRLAGNIEVGMSLQKRGLVKDDLLPTVGWVPEISNPRPITSTLDVSYDDIAKQVKEQLSGMDMGGKKLQIMDVSITNDEEFRVELQLTDPIKGSVVVSGTPTYSAEDRTLDLADLDVQVYPSNIIYKMTAPLVNKFIESKLSYYLPVDIGSIIDKQVADIPNSMMVEVAKIDPTIESVQVASIEFLKDSVVAEVNVSGARLQVTLV